MRFAWTVAGDDPDFANGDANGIDGYFYPMFDPLTTVGQLMATQARGYARGLYAAWSWPQFTGKTPVQVATTIRAEHKRFTDAGVTVLRVQWNNEEHAPDKIADELEAIRAALPKVNLSWSPEGMQGGWMGPVLAPGELPAPDGFVARVRRARVRIVPQGYWGPQGQIHGDWAHDQVLRDLTRRGFPEDTVSIFHDGATIGSKRDAEGYVFTMGRLPWLL